MGNKACPTKRIEGEAKAKMDAAHTRMRNIGKGKICSSTGHGTWGSMDVDKSHPKFGTIVRNAWDKKRGEYAAAHTKYNNEKKLFDAAAKAHVEAMAAFTTAVKIEANNANTACRNAHTQYNNLVKEVMSNVKSRRHVYIASLVITCYIGDLKVAKSCADKKRKSDTSQWNISASPLAACVSKGALEERFGPLSWKASSKSCELKHWNERAHKETQTKEKNNKETNAKELVAKEKTKKERNTKEVNAKEKAAKAKLERDTKAAKENKEKKDEKDLKERNTKENALKESNAKERELKKERADKEKGTKEAQAKEKVKKEKDAKEEKAKEEKAAKDAAKKKEHADKEKKNKEKFAKEKAREEKKDKAMERRDKDNERSSKKKEQQSKEANTKATERNNKAAAAERKKKADEKEQKRRVAGTCTVKAYEHNNYRGRLEQHHSVCRSGRYDIRYGTHGRRRGFQASSFKLSSGCKQVQLWDEDACRYNYGDNDNIRHSVASVKYDLNDDICGISIWSKC